MKGSAAACGRSLDRCASAIGVSLTSERSPVATGSAHPAGWLGSRFAAVSSVDRQARRNEIVVDVFLRPSDERRDDQHTTIRVFRQKLTKGGEKRLGAIIVGRAAVQSQSEKTGSPAAQEEGCKDQEGVAPRELAQTERTRG